MFYFHHRDAEQYQDFTPPAKAVFAASEDFTSAAAVESYHRFLRENNIEVVINQCGLFSDSTLYTNVHVDGMAALKVISVMHADPLLNYNHLFSQIAALRDASCKEFFKRIARCLLYPRIKRRYLHERVSSARFAITHSDAVALLSDGFKDAFRRLCGDEYMPEKVHAIPNPLPPVSMVPSTVPKKPWLLYVGRLDYNQKRPDRLLVIWKQLYKQFTEWELHIVGDGSYREQLERLSRKLPRVFIHGWQDPEPYYQQAKILLLTSSYEGFGMVLIEAMMKGTVPILFNSYAAAEDIVDDGKNGVLVPPFSISDYAHKLSELMTHNALWKSFSESAQTKAKQFSVEYIADKWETVMNLSFQNSVSGEFSII